MSTLNTFDDIGAGQTTVVPSTATVADPALSATGVNFNAQQYATTNNTAIATFTDAGPSNGPGDYFASVDWGDGSTNTFFETSVASVNGTLTVLGAHQYTTGGTFTVTTTVTDGGGSSATTTATATVAGGTPTLTAAAITAVEGNANTNVTVATFTGDPTGLTATIDWGDKSIPTAGTFTGTAVRGTHTYAETDSYTTDVTLTDASGTVVFEENGTATVADAALTASAPALTGVQGQSVSGVVATFTDANPHATVDDFTAAIDWGDGAQTAGTVAFSFTGFTVSGSNNYFEAGSYPVAVTLTDTDGTVTTATTTATISDAVLTVTGANLLPTQGVAQVAVTVATFTDAYQDTAATGYTATINWGDGTSSTSGTVSGANGTFSVQGSHIYATAANYPVSVSVSDVGGGATGTGAAYVQPTPFYTVATIYDSNPNDTAASFAATISWGDGTPATAGTITGGNGTFYVRGSHAFSAPGTDTRSVTVTNNGVNVGQAIILGMIGPAGATIGGLANFLAQPSAQIQEVDFGETGKQATGGLQVTSDPKADGTTTQYGSAWKADRSKKDPQAELFAQDPLAYVGGAAPSTLQIANLVFDIQAGAASLELFDPVIAIGQISGTGIADGTKVEVPVTVLSNRKELIMHGGNVTANKAFGPVTSTRMTIAWSIKLSDGRTFQAGSSSNQLYVTFKAPHDTRPLYETVLASGSIYNGGNPDTEPKMIENAWKSFKNRKVNSIQAERKGDATTALTYYGNYVKAEPIIRTKSLLSTQDGGYVAWSTFWIDVLEAQGVFRPGWIFQIKTEPSDLEKWYMVVKEWAYPELSKAGVQWPTVAGSKTLSGVNFWVNRTEEAGFTFVGAHGYNWLNDPPPQVTQDTTSKANLPGQGNPRPASLFDNHAVVKIDNELYDPSYGSTYGATTDAKGLAAFEKKPKRFCIDYTIETRQDKACI